MHRGLARPGITKVERPCGHALNPEPGRVSRRLHAGSRCVGNRDRPLWSLGIAAHWARHASGHNIGSNNHSGREKKNHSFSMASVGGPRGTGANVGTDRIESRVGAVAGQADHGHGTRIGERPLDVGDGSVRRLLVVEDLELQSPAQDADALMRSCSAFARWLMAATSPESKQRSLRELTKIAIESDD